jgi:hexosaminidase
VWTEYIPTKERLHYMVFPRLCAISETAWSPKDVRNFDKFIPRVAVHIERLKLMGISSANHLYEIDKKTESKDGTVNLTLSTLAEAKIYYTTDGSEPSENSTLYEGDITVSETTMIRTQAFSDGEIVGRGWTENFEIHKASGKTITLKSQPSDKYKGGGNSSIINGVFGSNERYGDSEWLGFEGENCEAIIDFGEATDFTNFSFRNFNGEGQWIYLPKSITVLMSNDGENFKEIVTVPVKKTEEKVVITSFEVKDKTSRYLKIIFESYGLIPEGQQGGGNASWLFVDEIIVN